MQVSLRCPFNWLGNPSFFLHIIIFYSVIKLSADATSWHKYLYCKYINSYSNTSNNDYSLLIILLYVRWERGWQQTRKCILDKKKRKEIKDGTIGEREKEKEVGERETIISWKIAREIKISKRVGGME